MNILERFNAMEYGPAPERLLAVLESTRQRQADPRKPRHRRSAGDPPFLHHAGWAQALDSEFPDHQPVGVVGQIIPWNFPLLMLAWKIAPALAAGNTVVLKPAEFTPLTALLFAEICEAGLPKGVVNIVTGDGETGRGHRQAFGRRQDRLHRLDRGRQDHPQGDGRQGKKLTLELGGKSAFIVFEDADLDSAVEGLVDAIWFNQGQVCCAGSRLLVQEGVAEALHRQGESPHGEAARRFALGQEHRHRPAGRPVQIDRVKGLVAEGAKQGATCWQPDFALPKVGHYFHPRRWRPASHRPTFWRRKRCSDRCWRR
jgi:aldehyde dehydrogenase (NAD+)